MNKHLIHTALVAGLLGAGIASAQTPAQESPVSRDAVKSEARVNNRNPANTTTPGGEASTRTNNQPNVTPQMMSGTTRAEVRQDAVKPKPQFGEKGERPDVPTNPKNATGTPK